MGHSTGVLQLGREIGLNSELSVGRWEFIAKGRGGVSAWKITKRKLKGKEGIRTLLNEHLLTPEQGARRWAQVQSQTTREIKREVDRSQVLEDVHSIPCGATRGGEGRVQTERGRTWGTCFMGVCEEGPGAKARSVNLNRNSKVLPSPTGSRLRGV